MTYQDFLHTYANQNGIPNAEVLLAQHAKEHAFQIRCRERAQSMIASLQQAVPFESAGKRVLDVGCAYGSFAIEFAKLGAVVTGIDNTERWLRLAEIYAHGEADVLFLNCDAS